MQAQLKQLWIQSGRQGADKLYNKAVREGLNVKRKDVQEFVKSSIQYVSELNNFQDDVQQIRNSAMCQCMSFKLFLNRRFANVSFNL